MIVNRLFLLIILGMVTPNEGCQPGPVDVMFVLSSESKLDKGKFDQKMDVVEEFIQSVFIGPNEVRVGILTENDVAILKFDMDDHMDKQELKLATKFVHFHAGTPTFGSGLEYIRKHGMDSHLGGRPSVPDVVIFLTDGVPNDAALAQAEAKLLTHSDVTVIALSGGDSGKSALINLASGCHYIAQTTDLSSTGVLAEAAVNLTCDAVRGVSIDDCECELVADVVFLLDASSPQSEHIFKEQINFTQEIVSNLNIGNNETRVAVVTYSTNSYPQFGLNEHTDKSELLMVLGFIPFQRGDERHMEEGLKYITDNIFSPNLATRGHAEKILIITYTGPLTTKNYVQYVQLLKNLGVIIIPVGIGSANQDQLSDIATNDFVSHLQNNINLNARALSLANLLCQWHRYKPTSVPLTTQSSSCSCQNGGTCIEIMGVMSCQCSSGYGGNNCQDMLNTMTTVAPGYCPYYNRSHWGCVAAELVFMIEYGREDVGRAIDHEGDYVKFLLQEYKVDAQHVRVGIVVYHDTVREVIHLHQYEDDLNGLINRINRLTTISLVPSGEVDFAQALDFVRQNSFSGSRPGVPKIVISINHQEPNQLDTIPQAGERLKNDCIDMIISAVRVSQAYGDILRQTIDKMSSGSVLLPFSSFTALEIAGYSYNLQCD